jgi:glycosyltransferase involved in cell wall biosynthesis
MAREHKHLKSVMRDFSLILATVGRTTELNRLFDSLLVQTFHDFEVIIVDQNQDERLTPIVHRARCLGLAIRHVHHFPPNLALARNTGIAEASGQWLGFPDDDCWYEPHTLERIRLRSRHRDYPQGIISRWVEQDAALPPGLLSWHRSSRFRDIPVSSITLFFQRNLINHIGGFDGRLGVGQWFGAGEETDIILRALRAGALVAYQPDSRVHHRVDPPQLAVSNNALKSARLRARGTGAMYAKHRLPMWVIARGLLSPIIKPLCKLTSADPTKHQVIHGYAIARGRLDGWLVWWVRHWREQRWQSWKRCPASESLSKCAK